MRPIKKRMIKICAAEAETPDLDFLELGNTGSYLSHNATNNFFSVDLP